MVEYATKGKLNQENLEYKVTSTGIKDVAVFDFTSIKKAENAARIIERKGSKLLVGLVGDSLLEVRQVSVSVAYHSMHKETIVISNNDGIRIVRAPPLAQFVSSLNESVTFVCTTETDSVSMVTRSVK